MTFHKDKISVTERAIFKDCRRKYFLSSILRLTKPVEALSQGKLWHELMELRLMQKECAIIEILASLKEHDPLIYNMYKNYHEAYKDEDLEAVETEQEYERPINCINPNAVLTGRPDGLVKYNNRLVIIEHKTSASTWNINNALYHDQALTYLYLVKFFKPDLTNNVLFNIAIKKYPDEPKLLVSGKGLSKAKITTTYDMYYATILKHNFNPDDYTDILMRIKNTPCELFQRFEIPYLAKQIEYHAKFIEHEFNDIMQCDTWDKAYPNFTTMRCGGCMFKTLCAEVYTPTDMFKAMKCLDKYGLKVKEDSDK